MEKGFCSIPIEKLVKAGWNYKVDNQELSEKLENNIKRNGQIENVIIRELDTGFFEVVNGNHRLDVLSRLGFQEVYCYNLGNITESQAKRIAVETNETKFTGKIDELAAIMKELSVEFDDIDLTMPFSQEEMDEMLNVDYAENITIETLNEQHKKLTDRFIVPPFSVLDSRQGYWNERKSLWRNRIKDNGESRKGVLSESELMSEINNGTSILDPVLAELIIRWFSTENSNIFDCFAGDTVFGFVAGYLGHNFTGIELREEQCEVNMARTKDYSVKYICDDGINVGNHIEKSSQDLFFSCPPYFDLEVYSDKENDASNQETYEDFLKIIETALKNSVKLLKENRFAVIVAGDVRNKKTGYYYRFVDDIKSIMCNNGMQLYNELILVEPIGTLPQRVARYMKNRKIGKCHQNVLVFFNGDTSSIKTIYKELEFFGEEDESSNI